jgi:hypothetical protein
MMPLIMTIEVNEDTRGRLRELRSISSLPDVPHKNHYTGGHVSQDLSRSPSKSTRKNADQAVIGTCHFLQELYCSATQCLESIKDLLHLSSVRQSTTPSRWTWFRSHSGVACERYRKRRPEGSQRGIIHGYRACRAWLDNLLLLFMEIMVEKRGVFVELVTHIVAA